ncbi:MAG: hypothetical protein ACUVWA_15435, partial [Candidatus Oleimicrobiaceae bacterium]
DGRQHPAGGELGAPGRDQPDQRHQRDAGAHRQRLDRPWARGDLYSIQKIVATIHAQDDSTLIPRIWLPIVLRN